MKTNLIIVPVGKPVDHFINQTGYPVKPEDHWRWRHNETNYDVLAVQYGDFVPEKGSYDTRFKIPGFKWTILKELHRYMNIAEYEYIGIYDDDVILDYHAMNKSFEIAKENNLKAFQISLAPGSESSYKCTQFVPGVEYATTNFIEVMCPVFRRDTFLKVMTLIEAYKIYTGWGMDYVLCEWLGHSMSVIHAVQMFHPSRPDTGSGYDKSAAFAEMHDVIYNVFPKLMAEHGRQGVIDYSRFEAKVLDVLLKL